jgi:hypothetical protein
MTDDPELIDVDTNTGGGMTFYVYRFADGSVKIRKPEGNDVARQHGIHTINLTAAESRALARILARKAKPVVAKETAYSYRPELYSGDDP